MPPKAEDAIVAELAVRHSVSEESVRVLLEAMRKTGGSMAQFNHPGLGGMGQWSGGMTMIGDMFNDRLRASVGALAVDLSEYLRSIPESKPEAEVSYRAGPGSSSDWWPAELGGAASAGSQNNLRYAVFPSKQLLAIEDKRPRYCL